jgi:hypothetical protein
MQAMPTVRPISTMRPEKPDAPAGIALGPPPSACGLATRSAGARDALDCTGALAPAPNCAASFSPTISRRSAGYQSAPRLAEESAIAASSSTNLRAVRDGTFASRAMLAAALPPCSAIALMAKNQSCSGVRRFSIGVPAAG